MTSSYGVVNTPRVFSRSYRFVLGERIERNLYDVLEMLIEAKFSKERLEMLKKVNLRLEILRHQIRLAKDLQGVRQKSYLHAAKAIDEIGRMLGGWLNSAKRSTMKRVGFLWEDMISVENLYRASRAARRGKRYRPACSEFEYRPLFGPEQQ